MLLFVENRQAADDRIQDERRADEEIQAEQAAIQEAMVCRLEVQAACIKRLAIIHSPLTPIRPMWRTSFAHSVKGKGGRCSTTHYLEALLVKEALFKTPFFLPDSHALELRAMVIFCRCGFRLNTHSDSLTLKDFENMLMRVLEAHR